MTSTIVEGGCLCRAVRYQIVGKTLDQLICHCQTCRHANGSPSVAWVTFRSSDFAFTTGEPANFRSSPSVVRTFCSKCGTSLTYQHESSLEILDVTTASLDIPDDFTPNREVWLEQKIVWKSIDPTLLHYPRSTSEGQGFTT